MRCCSKAKGLLLLSFSSAALAVLIVRPDIRIKLQKAIERFRLSVMDAYNKGRVAAIKKEEELTQEVEKPLS